MSLHNQIIPSRWVHICALVKYPKVFFLNEEFHSSFFCEMNSLSTFLVKALLWRNFRESKFHTVQCVEMKEIYSHTIHCWADQLNSEFSVKMCWFHEISSYLVNLQCFKSRDNNFSAKWAIFQTHFSQSMVYQTFSNSYKGL